MKLVQAAEPTFSISTLLIGGDNDICTIKQGLFSLADMRSIEVSIL